MYRLNLINYYNLQLDRPAVIHCIKHMPTLCSPYYKGDGGTLDLLFLMEGDRVHNSCMRFSISINVCWFFYVPTF